MVDLPSSLADSIFKRHADGAFLPLVEINIGDDEVAYLTPNPESVSWRGQTWRPYPMTIPPMQQGQDTTSITLNVVVYNIDEILTDYLREQKIQGQMARIYFVDTENLDQDEPLALFEAEVLGASIAHKSSAVTFTLGGRNWLARSPGRRFVRVRCIHAYGSPSCGYNLNRPGALTTCSRLLDDSNGCIAHGDDEAAAGLKRHHPDRFGGFLGIPRGNRG